MIKKKMVKKKYPAKKGDDRKDFKLKKKVDEAVDKAIHDFNEVFIELGKE